MITVQLNCTVKLLYRYNKEIKSFQFNSLGDKLKYYWNFLKQYYVDISDVYMLKEKKIIAIS